jgi:AraC-like DNA-binding protein
MNTIPDVAFRKRTGRHLEFEIFTLQSLFHRQPPIRGHGMDAPHRIHFFIIFFITQGQGNHVIDFQYYPYQPGTMFFISKGQVHAFEISQINDGYMLLFTETFLQKHFIQPEMFSFYRLYNYHIYTPVIQPEEYETEDFSSIINNIAQEYACPEDQVKKEILACYLKLLLLKAERIKEATTTKIRHSHWYHTFLLFKHTLETRYTTSRNAKEYAEMLHISYKHLNTICKEFTSLSAKRFIDRWMILELKRQLAISDLSVKEIAYQSGFDEPTNLVKFFKQRTGQTPTQFRQGFVA